MALTMAIWFRLLLRTATHAPAAAATKPTRLASMSGRRLREPRTNDEGANHASWNISAARRISPGRTAPLKAGNRCGTKASKEAIPHRARAQVHHITVALRR